MSYLASFLAKHDTRPHERAGGEPPEPTEGGSVSSVSAPPSRTRLDGLAVREMLGLRAAWLGALPLATTLVLDVARVAGPVTVGAHARSGPAMFDAAEWLAIVGAVKCDRAWPDDLVAWCQRKRADRGWRLTALEALGAVRIEPSGEWPVAHVLGRLDAELRAVVIEGGAGGA